MFMCRHLFTLESFHAVRCPAGDKDCWISRFYDRRLATNSDATSAFDYGNVFVVILILRDTLVSSVDFTETHFLLVLILPAYLVPVRRNGYWWRAFRPIVFDYHRVLVYRSLWFRVVTRDQQNATLYIVNSASLRILVMACLAKTQSLDDFDVVHDVSRLPSSLGTSVLPAQL